jgi:hypothetical protein
MVRKIFRSWRKPKRHPLPFMRLPMNGNDYRGIPTCECLCGCDSFIVLCKFDPEEKMVSWYALDGVCGYCGSLVTLPYPDCEDDYDNPNSNV